MGVSPRGRSAASADPHRRSRLPCRSETRQVPASAHGPHPRQARDGGIGRSHLGESTSEKRVRGGQVRTLAFWESSSRQCSPPPLSRRRVLPREGERQVYSPWALQFVAKRKPAPPRASALRVLARCRRGSSIRARLPWPLPRRRGC